MLFPVFLSLALSAFMSTPSSSAYSDTEMPSELFPSYEGDRKVLMSLVELFGIESIPRDAKGVNDIFTDNFFLQLVELRLLDIKNMSKLGALMQELEPNCFDQLCSFVVGRVCDISPLVTGYGKDCQWSKALVVTKDGVLTKENAPLFLDPSPELCKLMEDRPLEFLKPSCLTFCLEIWVSSRPDLVRTVLHKFPERNAWGLLSSFEGYEDEFVEWFIKSVEEGRSNQHIRLPKTLLRDHLVKMKDFLSSNLVFIPSFSHQFEDEELAKEVDAMNSLIISSEIDYHYGFNTDLFDDKDYVIANRKIFRHPVISHLGKSHPIELHSALRAALIFGDFQILKNSIGLIVSLSPDHANDIICNHFWIFFENIHQERSLASWRQLFALVKEHLRRITNLRSHKWLLKPLFEDMLKSPSLYWPSQLIERGNQWAQQALDVIPKTAEEAIAARNHTPAFAVLKFALKNGWNEMAKGLLSDDTILPYLDHDLLVSLIDQFGKKHVRNEIAQRLGNSLKPKLSLIALSANMDELEGMLLISTPREILALCGNPFLRKRIGLMLHLIPWLHSYKADGKMVVKTSLFFRNWIMIRLFTENPADLSLLYYYWSNLLMQVYAGDPVSEDRVFALAGQGHPQKDPMLTLDLIFESSQSKESEVPKVEEVKDGEGEAHSKEG